MKTPEKLFQVQRNTLIEKNKSLANITGSLRSKNYKKGATFMFWANLSQDWICVISLNLRRFTMEPTISFVPVKVREMTYQIFKEIGIYNDDMIDIPYQPALIVLKLEDLSKEYFDTEKTQPLWKDLRENYGQDVSDQFLFLIEKYIDKEIHDYANYEYILDKNVSIFKLELLNQIMQFYIPTIYCYNKKNSDLDMFIHNAEASNKFSVVNFNGSYRKYLNNLVQRIRN